MKRHLSTSEKSNKIIKTNNNNSESIMISSKQEGIGGLVADNWAHIFSYLDPARDLLPNVMPVCKMFYQKILGGNNDDNNDDSALYCKSLVYERVSLGTKNGYPTRTFLGVRKFDKDYLNRLLGYVIRVSPKNGCKVLHLGREHEHNDSLTFEFTVDFFKRCIESGVFDGLKELRLASSITVLLKDEQGCAVFKEWISRLKQLERIYCSSTLPNDILDCIFTNWLNMREMKLDLGNYQLEETSPVLEKLESVEFNSGSEAFSEETLDSLFKHAPNLKKLRLGYCMGHPTVVFQSLAQNCKNLTDLTFSERYINETDSMSIVTSQLLNLETLVLEEGGIPYGENLLELSKLTKLKKFVFGIDEFKDCDEDNVAGFIVNDLGKTLIWADNSYLSGDGDNEEEDQQEEDEDEEEEKPEKQELGLIELANKRFPRLEVLEISDSDLEEKQVTLTQIFQQIPNLREVKIGVVNGSCDKVFESVEEDIKVRNEASNRLLELFGERNKKAELFDHRIFYHRIGEKKLRIRICDIEYDGIVQFKIKLVY